MPGTQPSIHNILVLGGGIVGLATATWLLKNGHRVTLADKDEPGDGASFGDAGIFANYATVPLASKDTLRSLPRKLIKRDGAVSVRPDYWPRMVGFGKVFLRATSASAYRHNRRCLVDLLGEDVEVKSEWCGSRASTPDGLPLIGRIPGHDNLLVATGHGHLGVTFSGITGKIIAQALAGGSLCFDIRNLRLDRF